LKIFENIFAKKLRNGEITKEEYDAWRYNYPKAEVDAYKNREQVTVLSPVRIWQ
jgi:hypothetical protein